MAKIWAFGINKFGSSKHKMKKFMDYHQHYEKLITRARNRILEGYTENHHIIPKCQGGSDHPENLVRLTAREHYIAHQLLAKMHPENYSLQFAANMMTVGPNRRGNRQYGWLKERFSAAMSEIGRTRIGEKNPMWGRQQGQHVKDAVKSANTGMIRTDAHREAISRAQTGKQMSEETRRKISEKLTGREFSDSTRKKMSKSQKGKKRSEEFCRRRSELTSGENNPMYGKGHLISGENNPMYGRKHSYETRKKISEKGSGKNHSQYGTMWITDGNTAKKIKKDELIPPGWRKGRK